MQARAAIYRNKYITRDVNEADTQQILVLSYS